MKDNVELKNIEPDADLLVLVSQVEAVAVVVVEGPDGPGRWPKEVLNASLRGQIAEVARQLGDLSRKKNLEWYSHPC